MARTVCMIIGCMSKWMSGVELQDGIDRVELKRTVRFRFRISDHSPPTHDPLTPSQSRPHADTPFIMILYIYLYFDNGSLTCIMPKHHYIA